MMKRAVVLMMCVGLLCISIIGCSSSGTSSFPGKYDMEKVSDKLVGANNGFSFDIFKKLIEEDGDKSVFISPFSISTALSMTYNGAATTTKEAMAKTLGYDGLELEVLNESYCNLISYLNNVDKKVKLDVANSIWIREGEQIKEDFISRNKELFNAEADMLDFSLESSVDTINRWISDATNGKIDKMLVPPISPDVVMYLINAIYFKGEWTRQFNPELTSDTVFTNGAGQKQAVKMMTRKGKTEYVEADGYKTVKLPYGSGKTAMYCILPEEGTDINEFAGRMDEEEWENIRNGVSETEDVILQIPRFKVEYGIKNLNDSLKVLGMEEAFSGNADFSGIREGIFISRVLHKAVIEVNEEGSEAAGATVVVMEECAGMNITFIANRPFLFIIAEEETGSILFMGKLSEVIHS
jgi:serine protease inhibitor